MPMLTTRVSSKGQVVIPKQVREEVGIEEGAVLEVTCGKEGIVLTPLSGQALKSLLGRFAGEDLLGALEAEHAEETAREADS